jgi:nucleotide-binding universal stress UspA family protein
VYDRILIPTDGSPCSDEAVRHGLAIARAMGGAVLFLFVMDTLSARHEGVVNVSEARDTLTATGEAIVKRATDAARISAVQADAELVTGSPADEIVRRSADFDLLVMGSEGKGLLKRLTVGSVTESVLRRTLCPMLVVRQHAPR